jgi:hypothetical protein
LEGPTLCHYTFLGQHFQWLDIMPTIGVTWVAANAIQERLDGERSASMTRVAGASMRGGMRTIVSPRIATSPQYHRLPVPSTIRPLRIMRSKTESCAHGVAIANASDAAAAATDARETRMRRSIAGGMGQGLAP